MANERLYDLLERIGNLFRAARRLAGLLPVHLAALRYLNNCNRYSNTPAALAEYLGLTRGTVSQSLLVLERRGFVKKVADRDDRRVARLRITAGGRRLITANTPPEVLRTAVAAMETPSARSLEGGLEELLRAMQASTPIRSFGVCGTCRFFRREESGFRCGLTNEPLSLEESALICREHEGADEALTGA